MKTDSPPTKIDTTPLLAAERARVLPAADGYLRETPITITAYPAPRSAGGPHDFFSEADYFWPNPANPDGPYINRDGMTNPGNFLDHRRALFRMCRIVPTLTAATLLSNDGRYARQAALHLCAWFVAPATRMNPNLEYAQAVHGVTTGRSYGIIDTIHLIEPARSIPALERAGALSSADATTIRCWFSDYLHWLMESDKGRTERDAANNHSTCHAMQVAAFAALVGDDRQLTGCRVRYKTVLLPRQMGRDGSFPLEIKRTKPYGYSLFNLDAMATLCRIASIPTDDLWRFTLPDGRSIRTGVDYLLPYIQDKRRWPYPHDVMYWDDWPVRSPALLFAGMAFGEPRYIDLWRKLPADSPVEEIQRNLAIREPALWIGAGNEG